MRSELLIPQQNDNGTLSATVDLLKLHDFGSCVINGRPCVGARVIDPTPHGETVCCSIRHAPVNPGQALHCDLRR